MRATAIHPGYRPAMQRQLRRLAAVCGADSDDVTLDANEVCEHVTIGELGGSGVIAVPSQL